MQTRKQKRPGKGRKVDDDMRRVRAVTYVWTGVRTGIMRGTLSEVQAAQDKEKGNYCLTAAPFGHLLKRIRSTACERISFKDACKSNDKVHRILRMVANGCMWQVVSRQATVLH